MIMLPFYYLMQGFVPGEQAKAWGDPAPKPNQYSTPLGKYEQVCGEGSRAGVCRRSSSHPADHIDFGRISYIYTLMGLASEPSPGELEPDKKPAI